MKYFLILFLFISFNSFAEDRTECTVTYVVDGDTFDCKTASGIERIRLIGVNTPEKNTDQGKIASQFTSSQIPVGKTVKLELDAKEYGPYKRLLAYVYLQDGSMLNELLVKEGFAQVATYPPNVKYKDKFLEAQKQARKNKKGFWREQRLVSLVNMAENLSLEKWSYVATIAASVVAIVTLFFIYIEIRAKRKQEKRERSFHFVQKHYDNDHIEHAIKIMNFFRDGFKSNDEKWRLAREDPDTKKSARIFLNYFEELGLSYNTKLVDRTIIERMIGEASLDNFSIVKWYVDRYQKEDMENDPDTPEDLLTYIQWTIMNKSIKKARKNRIRINRFKKKLIQYYNGQW